MPSPDNHTPNPLSDLEDSLTHTGNEELDADLDDILDQIPDTTETEEEDAESDLRRFSIQNTAPEPEAGTEIAPNQETPRAVRARRAGSERAEDRAPVPVGELVVDFHRLFRQFYVDWNRRTPYSILGQPTRRAALVGWTADDIKSVERTSRLYTHIARVCPGPTVPRTNAEGQQIPPDPDKVCHCERIHGADPEVWSGYPCPAETLFLFQNFVQYVRDLRIKPEDHVDVKQVIEIVKLELYELRQDELIQANNGVLQGIVVGTLDQRAGTVYWDKTIGVPLQTQSHLATRRLKLYQNLIASREARADKQQKDLKAIGAAGTGGAMMTMSQMMAELNQFNINQRRQTQILDASTVEGELQSSPDLPEATQEILDADLNLDLTPLTP